MDEWVDDRLGVVRPLKRAGNPKPPTHALTHITHTHLHTQACPTATAASGGPVVLPPRPPSTATVKHEHSMYHVEHMPLAFLMWSVTITHLTRGLYARPRASSVWSVSRYLSPHLLLLYYTHTHAGSLRYYYSYVGSMVRAIHALLALPLYSFTLVPSTIHQTLLSFRHPLTPIDHHPS